MTGDLDRLGLILPQRCNGESKVYEQLLSLSAPLSLCVSVVFSIRLTLPECTACASRLNMLVRHTAPTDLYIYIYIYAEVRATLYTIVVTSRRILYLLFFYFLSFYF